MENIAFMCIHLLSTANRVLHWIEVEQLAVALVVDTHPSSKISSTHSYIILAPQMDANCVDV